MRCLTWRGVGGWGELDRRKEWQVAAKKRVLNVAVIGRGMGRAHLKAYQEFVDAVLAGREPLATGEHGLDVQLILNAIYKSAQTGREVRIRRT